MTPETPAPASDAAPAPAPARRLVRSRMVLEVDAPTHFVTAVAVAHGPTIEGERLRVALGGADVEVEELADGVGGRLHTFSTARGLLEIEYGATVVGSAPAAPVGALEAIEYLRPSRYCPADDMVGLARGEFAGLEPAQLLDAVPAWVHDRLEYRADASSPRGGALETIDRRAGVCRDFAHVVIGLLRALDVPARLVAVYAPGLEPMDFHAVVEVLVDDAWHVVDATRLAPRADMVRIATGRDAADTAFLTNTLSDIRLVSLEVDAQRADLSTEDPTARVALA
jgi:transglutaminase-like putative cysteine protease